MASLGSNMPLSDQTNTVQPVVENCEDDDWDPTDWVEETSNMYSAAAPGRHAQPREPELAPVQLDGSVPHIDRGGLNPHSRRKKNPHSHWMKYNCTALPGRSYYYHRSGVSTLQPPEERWSRVRWECEDEFRKGIERAGKIDQCVGKIDLYKMLRRYEEATAPLRQTTLHYAKMDNNALCWAMEMTWACNPEVLTVLHRSSTLCASIVGPPDLEKSRELESAERRLALARSNRQCESDEAKGCSPLHCLDYDVLRTVVELMRAYELEVLTTLQLNSLRCSRMPKKILYATKISRNMHFTIFIVGEPFTGKRSLVRRHRTGDFDERYTPLIGGQHRTLDFYTNLGWLRFDVFQPGGCNFESKCNLYMANFNKSGRTVDGAILMYDVGSKFTYKVCPRHAEALSRFVGTDPSYRYGMPIVGCGNKVDKERRKVQLKQEDNTVLLYRNGQMMRAQKAEALWRSPGVQHCEISVKTKSNIDKPFLYLARMLTRCAINISQTRDFSRANSALTLLNDLAVLVLSQHTRLTVCS